MPASPGNVGLNREPWNSDRGDARLDGAALMEVLHQEIPEGADAQVGVVGDFERGRRGHPKRRPKCANRCTGRGTARGWGALLRRSPPGTSA